jgi:hypothetical protein
MMSRMWTVFAENIGELTQIEREEIETVVVICRTQKSTGIKNIENNALIARPNSYARKNHSRFTRKNH